MSFFGGKLIGESRISMFRHGSLFLRHCLKLDRLSIVIDGGNQQLQILRWIESGSLSPTGRSLGTG